MKRIIFATLILCNSFLATQIYAQNWFDNYDLALEEAEQNSQPIMMIFQGSDWCAPCIKLDRTVWTSPAFQTFSSEHFVLLRVDFPRRKKNRLDKELETHNNKLAEKYNRNGVFPLIVIVDSTGNVIAETGYKDFDAEEYITHLQKIIVK